MMKFRFVAFIGIATLAFALGGCNPTTNDNANANMAANANTRANTNMANENRHTNANANSNSNRALTREEYERDKERYEREAKQSGRTIGTGLNDGWLWVKTRFDLAATDDLRDSTINVDVNNGVVTLTGTVANPAQTISHDRWSRAQCHIVGLVILEPRRAELLLFQSHAGFPLHW